MLTRSESDEIEFVSVPLTEIESEKDRRKRTKEWHQRKELVLYCWLTHIASCLCKHITVAIFQIDVLNVPVYDEVEGKSSASVW